MITAARLRELLLYNEQSGQFVWLVSRGKAAAGKIAGSTNRGGYIEIRIDKKTYLAHRLAFLWVAGEMPSGEIDHIDGNRSNNALSNLRDVNGFVNHQNQRRAHKSNRTGLLGVSWRESKGRYRASIDVDGRKIHLGYFSDKEAAHAAYINAKRAMHKGCTI